MESLRVLLRFKKESAFSGLLVDPDLLNPVQATGAKETMDDGIEAPHELVPEAENPFGPIPVFFDDFGLAEIRQSEAHVKRRIDEERGEGLSRCMEVVL